MPHAKTIISCSLPYAWQEAVKFVRKSPQIIVFGGGTEIKHARDSQCQIILDHHAIQDALNHITHPSDPFCSEDRLRIYIQEYDKNFDASKFSYTYRGEMETSFVISEGTDNEIDNTIYLSLTQKIINGLKFQIDSTFVDKNNVVHKGLPSNRNVITLLNNGKWNMMSSMPCWNILWIRLERIDPDGTVWVSIASWYRSHDLTDAWESNFIAQVTFIQKEILDPLNAKILHWSESNASLHIYEHNIDTANSIKTISVNPSFAGLQRKYEE